MVEHVLVPIDDSKRSTKALEFALGEYPGAEITALHVMDPSDDAIYTGGELSVPLDVEEVREQHKRRAETLLEEAREVASDHGVEIDTATRVGKPARAIVEYAEEQDVDHVVLGSHGRSGASRILLGSVAERVARRAPVPVTIVR
ncbi:universal stress protein [Halalkalicoccus sp. NIPERK01]|uniref:universal stress protein n=1 Tax=Halalkalicoccus sp. NIPERK01 TaxID=3053469 RepID=UPI00256F12DB|nr:universal stress protein [Halalkalicoccus sp. NIPERK01]MDL5361247.1 universal stress protein [Halalkalicoccus sp. NIPERK01]